MFIHYQLFGEELKTEETNRVTMLEDGSQKFGVPGRVLVLGTYPTVRGFVFKGIPLANVQWFWIEEN